MVMDVGRIVDNTKRTREQKPKKFHRPTICSYQQLLIASLLINNKHIQLIENALMMVFSAAMVLTVITMIFNQFMELLNVLTFVCYSVMSC